MPPYRTSFKRIHRARLRTNRDFEAENIVTPLESPTMERLCNATETQTNTNQALNCIPSTASPSIENLTPIRNTCGGNLPLNLAIDLVPRFDGQSTTCTIFKFIKQCRLANSLVKHNDQINLFALILNKIEGLAEQIINNRREPKDLTELISIFKSTLMRNYDLDHIFDELKIVRQEDKESVEIFGQRVNTKLNNGLEAIRENFNADQVTGVMALLNQAAIAGFTRGLQNQFVSLIISKDQPKDLESAIAEATKLEQEVEERERRLGNRNTRVTARVYTSSTVDVQCYGCKGIGHFKKDCPRTQTNSNLNNSGNIYCTFCNKPGHTERRCFRKNRNRPYPISLHNRKTVENHLNSNHGLQTGAMRSEPLIACAQVRQSTSN